MLLTRAEEYTTLLPTFSTAVILPESCESIRLLRSKAENPAGTAVFRVELRLHTPGEAAPRPVLVKFTGDDIALNNTVATAICDVFQAYWTGMPIASLGGHWKPEGISGGGDAVHGWAGPGHADDPTVMDKDESRDQDFGQLAKEVLRLIWTMGHDVSKRGGLSRRDFKKALLAQQVEALARERRRIEDEQEAGQQHQGQAQQDHDEGTNDEDSVAPKPGPVEPEAGNGADGASTVGHTTVLPDATLSTVNKLASAMAVAPRFLSSGPSNGSSSSAGHFTGTIMARPPGHVAYGEGLARTARSAHGQAPPGGTTGRGRGRSYSRGGASYAGSVSRRLSVANGGRSAFGGQASGGAYNPQYLSGQAPGQQGYYPGQTSYSMHGPMPGQYEPSGPEVGYVPMAMPIMAHPMATPAMRQGSSNQAPPMMPVFPQPPHHMQMVQGHSVGHEGPDGQGATPSHPSAAGAWPMSGWPGPYQGVPMGQDDRRYSGVQAMDSPRSALRAHGYGMDRQDVSWDVAHMAGPGHAMATGHMEMLPTAIMLVRLPDGNMGVVPQGAQSPHMAGRV